MAESRRFGSGEAPRQGHRGTRRVIQYMMRIVEGLPAILRCNGRVCRSHYATRQVLKCTDTREAHDGHNKLTDNPSIRL